MDYSTSTLAMMILVLRMDHFSGRLFLAILQIRKKCHEGMIAVQQSSPQKAVSIRLSTQWRLLEMQVVL